MDVDNDAALKQVTESILVITVTEQSEIQQRPAPSADVSDASSLLNFLQTLADLLGSGEARGIFTSESDCFVGITNGLIDDIALHISELANVLENLGNSEAVGAPKTGA
jgi:hypothetical protein